MIIISLSLEDGDHSLDRDIEGHFALGGIRYHILVLHAFQIIGPVMNPVSRDENRDIIVTERIMIGDAKGRHDQARLVDIALFLHLCCKNI